MTAIWVVVAAAGLSGSVTLPPTRAPARSTRHQATSDNYR